MLLENLTNLIDILTNRAEGIKTYILNWLAHLLQKPQEIPGVAIILNGQKGAGKDTLGDFFGEYIIGNQYYQNYQNQAQYFNKHDELKVNKYLVKLEELDKKMLEMGVNGEIFKSAVTSSKLNIDPKNGRPFNTTNVQHILISSNKSLPVNVEQKETSMGNFSCITRKNRTTYFLGRIKTCIILSRRRVSYC